VDILPLWVWDAHKGWIRIRGPRHEGARYAGSCSGVGKRAVQPKRSISLWQDVCEQVALEPVARKRLHIQDVSGAHCEVAATSIRWRLLHLLCQTAPTTAPSVSTAPMAMNHVTRSKVTPIGP
jgi:hypothetical protein